MKKFEEQVFNVPELKGISKKTIAVTLKMQTSLLKKS